MGIDKIPHTSDKLTSMLLVEIHNKLIDIEEKLSGNIEKEITNDLKLAVSAKDVKGYKSFPEGDLLLKKYQNYYDNNDIIRTAQIINPNDEDHPNYNRERVFESLERNAEILYVSNDGIYNIYVITSHKGGQSFTRERILYPGEVKEFYNIYELRIRGLAAETPYRVSEYNINTGCCPIRATVLNNLSTPIVNPGITIPGLGSGSSGIANYIVTGDFKLSTIEVSASGATKIQIKAGDIGFETLYMTAFTSPSSPTIQLKFDNILQLYNGQRLQVIITNRELQAMDVYTTIMGFNS